MSNSFWNYVFIGSGIIAAVWFFAGYPSQDPRSSIDLSVSRETAELSAAEKLAELGYSLEDYSAEITLRGNNPLLDSLQHYLGRDNAILRLKEDPPVNIKPYYWEVLFFDVSPSAAEETEVKVSAGGKDGSEVGQSLTVRVDPHGKVFELQNNAGILPDKLVLRDVLYAVFADTAANPAETLLPLLPDSLLRKLLNFNFQQSVDSSSKQSGRLSAIVKSLRQKIPHRLSRQDAALIAEYHINNMGWTLADMALDTVTIEQVESMNTAQVRFRTKSPVMGQHLTLSAQVTPTGGLIGLQPEYEFPDNTLSSWEDIWSVMRGGIVFLFGLGIMFIFFFRIRARAIDTRSALVVSVIAGLAVSIFILLGNTNKIHLFSATANMMESVMLIIFTGMAGALSCMAFFVLFSVSDSITRQYWPDKLESYDYLRQGMIFNKPIGLVVLRSLVAGFILAGIWTFALWLLPGLYIQFSPVIYSGAVSWPPLYLFLRTGLFSFSMIIILFLIVGSQVFAQTKNTWLAGAAMTLACGLIVPEISDFGPPPEEFLVGLILGASLTLMYLRWDFLTVLFSHFLFLGLLGSSSGWVISNSPDMYLFVSFLFFLLFLCVWGSLAYIKGKEERVLPRYIPDYIDELAQEERIRQELQIARKVQQSFLPVRTPDIMGLDIAALCKPAYETGGDYYDFIRLDEHRIALTIGDVSGKGIQAAFYMTFTKGILHSLCREVDSPAELLVKANRLFYDNANKGTFISLVYGIIDLKQQTFTFARGGHNPIIRINSKTGLVEELQPGGLGLGLTKQALFDNNIKEIQLTLCEDDLLVLYTDGVVEALNEARQLYGDKRLVSLLQEEKGKPSSEILSSLLRDVTSFTGTARQHDDMTVMVIKFNGKF